MKKFKSKGQIIKGELIAIDNNGKYWNVFHYDKNKKVEIFGALSPIEAEKIYREKINALRGI